MALLGALSLSGCNSVSSDGEDRDSDSPPREPAFYIAHLQDRNAIWAASSPPVALDISALPAGASVSNLAALRFNGTADWLYLVSTKANALVILYQSVASTFEHFATVPVGANPYGLAIDGDANFAYVSNTGGDSVTVVDLRSSQSVRTIALPAGSQPRAIAVTPDGRKVYVANFATSTVSVIDAIERTVGTPIPVGRGPAALAMSPDGKQLYVSNSGDGTVSMIDVTSGEVSTVITGADGTQAVALNDPGTHLLFGQRTSTNRTPSGIPIVAGLVTLSDASRIEPIAVLRAERFQTDSEPVHLLVARDYFLALHNAGVTIGSLFSTRKVCTPAPCVEEPWPSRTYPVGAGPSALAIVRTINRTSPTQPAAQNVTLTVATSPAGLQARIGTTGDFAAAPVSLSVTANQPQTVAVADPQYLAAMGTGYRFTGWSNGALTAATAVTPAANLTATATFTAACYALTFTASPTAGGSVTASPAAGGLAGLPSSCYAPGTVVTLTATPATGFTLASWTGATGTGNTATVTMSAARAVVANFGAPAGVTTTVSTTPVGLLARIGTSGVYSPAPVSMTAPADQELTISVTDPQYVAATGTGYRFSRWQFAITGPLTSTGASTATTLVGPGADLGANAIFNVACYTFLTTVSPAAGGAVTLSPATGGLPGLPSSCYAPGATVTVTATPAPGYVNQGSAVTDVVVNSGNTTHAANFTLYPPPAMRFAFTSASTVVGNRFQASGVLTNMGTSAYNNVTITQITFEFIPASASLTNATPLPLPLGNLPAGGVSQSVTISVELPPTGIPPGAQVAASISGTAVIPQTGQVVAWAIQ
jgi:YVTN family beta-propeller protein